VVTWRSIFQSARHTAHCHCQISVVVVVVVPAAACLFAQYVTDPWMKMIYR